METTLTRLTTVFHDVFDDDTIVLTPETTADDIEAWDSLMHVTLLVNIERTFDIAFPSAQVELLRDVSELVELIDMLRAASPRDAARVT